MPVGWAISLAIALVGIIFAAVRVFTVCLRSPGLCPRCGSPAIRRSTPRGIRESITAALRFGRYRCSACRARFSLRNVTFSSVELAAARKSDAMRQARRRKRKASPSPPIAPEPAAIEPTGIEPAGLEPADIEPAAIEPVGIDAVERLEETAIRVARRSRGVRTRRRTSKGRSAIPWIALAVGLLSIVAFVLFWQPVPPASRRVSTTAALPAKPITVAPQPLELGEATLAEGGNDRRISGFVRNKDKLPYRDVEILFSTWGANHSRLGTVRATIDLVEGGGTATFQTEAVPAGTLKYELRTLNGTHP
jgi:hypothetical protein